MYDHPVESAQAISLFNNQQLLVVKFNMPSPGDNQGQAANMAGSKKWRQIILPVENKEDWEKVDLEIKSSLKVSFVSKFEEIFKIVFTK